MTCVVVVVVFLYCRYILCNIVYFFLCSRSHHGRWSMVRQPFDGDRSLPPQPQDRSPDLIQELRERRDRESGVASSSDLVRSFPGQEGAPGDADEVREEDSTVRGFEEAEIDELGCGPDTPVRLESAEDVPVRSCHGLPDRSACHHRQSEECEPEDDRRPEDLI